MKQFDCGIQLIVISDTGMHELVGTCLNWFGCIKETDGEEVQSILLPFERSQTVKLTQQLKLIGLAFHNIGTTPR